MAFGSLLLASGLSAAIVWQSMQSRVIAYVVEVDAHGAARAIAPADAHHQPSDPQIAWHLGRFIAGVRSRSLDPVLMRDNWLTAFDFVTPRGAVQLGDYARASDPFADVGRRTVAVQVTSAVRASPTSYRINWTEQAFEGGSLAETQRWTGIITYRIKPPVAVDALRKNPLGIYIDGVDWSRELEPEALRELPQRSWPSSHGAQPFPPAPERETPVRPTPRGSLDIADEGETG